MTRSLRAILAGCFITAMMVSTSVSAQQVLPTPLSLFVTLVLSDGAEIQWDSIPFPANYRVYSAQEWPLGPDAAGVERAIVKVRVLIAGPDGGAASRTGRVSASLPSFRAPFPAD